MWPSSYGIYVYVYSFRLRVSLAGSVDGVVATVLQLSLLLSFFPVGVIIW